MYSTLFPSHFSSFWKLMFLPFTFCNTTMIHTINRLKSPLWTCSSQNLHHVIALQCLEDRRICETTWIRRPETSSSSTWGSSSTKYFRRKNYPFFRLCGKFSRVTALESSNPHEMNSTLFWFGIENSLKEQLGMATMYTVFGGILLNLGVTLANQGSQVIANESYVGAGKLFLTPKTFTLEYFFFLSLDIFKFAFINFPVAKISGFVKMQAFSWYCLLGPCKGWKS